MTTMTVNIKEETARLFRKRAYQIYGRKKGTLGKAISEAMLQWSKRKEYFDTCMNLLEQGINMGKIKYADREKLHDRS